MDSVHLNTTAPAAVPTIPSPPTANRFADMNLSQMMLEWLGMGQELQKTIREEGAKALGRGHDLFDIFRAKKLDNIETNKTVSDTNSALQIATGVSCLAGSAFGAFAGFKSVSVGFAMGLDAGSQIGNHVGSSTTAIVQLTHVNGLTKEAEEFQLHSECARAASDNAFQFGSHGTEEALKVQERYLQDCSEMAQAMKSILMSAVGR